MPKNFSCVSPWHLLQALRQSKQKSSPVTQSFLKQLKHTYLLHLLQILKQFLHSFLAQIEQDLVKHFLQ